MNQNIGSKQRLFGPFSFSDNPIVNSEDCRRLNLDHIISANFDDSSLPFDVDSSEPAPILGLNLKEYFQKRHLVDQVPVEPLPPIENPLEMTQSHEEWLRGQKDFKINLE